MEIVLNNRKLSIEDDESVLNASIRSKCGIPNSCRNGICQTCLIKVDQGCIPAAAQMGLNENQKKQNFALACQLFPKSDLTLHTLDKRRRVSATVIEHNSLNSKVLRLRLDANINWSPGQFLSVWKSSNVGRPYSIASLKSEGFVELHVKYHSQGEVSRWLHNQITIGNSINIGESHGNCFYNIAMRDRALILAGIGTGLAPLYGIVRDALMSKHVAPIHLLLAGSTIDDFYLIDELNRLDKEFDNFYFHPVLRDEKRKGFIEGEIANLVPEIIPTSKKWCAFLCGAPVFVQKIQKLCFLSGLPMADIFSDPFILNEKQ
ncbi:FAD-binding oxidoreductase [Aurantivibrio infirmus]